MKFENCDHCEKLEFRMRHIPLMFKHWILCSECYPKATLVFKEYAEPDTSDSDQRS